MNRWKPPMSMWLQKCYFPLLLPFDFGKLLPLSFLNFLYTSYTEPKPHTHKGRKRPLKTAAISSLSWDIIVSNSVMYDYFNTSILFSRPYDIDPLVIKRFYCRLDVCKTDSPGIFRRQTIFNHLAQNGRCSGRRELPI